MKTDYRKRERIIILVALGILALSALLASVSHAKTSGNGCNPDPRAGIAEMVIENTVQLYPVHFPTPFCEIPVMVATGGENVKNVQIGVVAPRVGWLLVTGVVGDTVKIHWIATEPNN